MTPGRHLGFWKKRNSFRRLIVGSVSMLMLNFVPIRWIESICRAEMWFVGSNLVTFWPLTPGSHLGFWKKSKSLAEAYFWGQVVCPCLFLSKPDEWNPYNKQKCVFVGSNLVNLDLWPLTAILDFEKINELFQKINYGVN